MQRQMPNGLSPWSLPPSGRYRAARHLVNHGGRVTLVVSDVARLAGVPAEQLTLYRATGGRLAEAGDLGTLTPSLIVDAVLGYSLAGAPHGAVSDLIVWMSHSDAPVVALDVPSGVDATSGDCLGVHVPAVATMTLALPKTGLDADAVGDLWVADIGIPGGVLERAGVRLPPVGLFSRGYRTRLSQTS